MATGIRPQSKRTPAAPYQGERIHNLDSLRGIAAALVVMSHLFLFNKGQLAPLLGDWIAVPPLTIVTTGRPCVIFFFVLSGFVLSLRWCTGHPPSYVVFVFRRCCRIYVPYAVMAGGAGVLYAVVASLGGEAPVRPSLPAIASHLLMSGTAEGTSLNGPSWSLVYEMRISLVFPLVASVCLFVNSAAVVIAATSLAAGCLAALSTSELMLWPYYSTSSATAFAITAYFAWFFVLGTILAKHRGAVARRLARASGMERLMLLTVAVTLLALNVDVCSGIGSACILALVLAGHGSHFLSRRPIRWLGKVSYSLYLAHFPLLWTARELYGPGLVASASGVAASLLFAWALYQYIEQPAMRLGAGTVSRASIRISDAN